MILDATERRLETVGPDGIRLKDVASSVGVSHTLLLHHFGTRERLLQAVVERRIAELRERLLTTLTGSTPSPHEMRELLEQICAAVGDPIQLKILAWLGLSERSPFRPSGALTFRRVAEALHRMRIENGRRRNLPEPPFDDSIFVVLLASSAVLGEVLLEPVFLPSAGLDNDPTARQRYRDWLLALLARWTDAEQ